MPHLDAFSMDSQRRATGLPREEERTELVSWSYLSCQDFDRWRRSRNGQLTTRPRRTRAIMALPKTTLSNWYVRLARKRFWEGLKWRIKQAGLRDPTLWDVCWACRSWCLLLRNSIRIGYSKPEPKLVIRTIESIHLTGLRKNAGTPLWSTKSWKKAMTWPNDLFACSFTIERGEKMKVRQPHSANPDPVDAKNSHRFSTGRLIQSGGLR